MDKSSNSAAGGLLIAAGAMVGAFGGAAMGQATLGFLGGTGAGIVIAALLWWRNRS